MFRLNFKAKTVSNFVKRDFLNLTVYFALATKIQIEPRLFPSVDLLSLPPRLRLRCLWTEKEIRVLDISLDFFYI
jgi:hypothetical protein